MFRPAYALLFAAASGVLGAQVPASLCVKDEQGRAVAGALLFTGPPEAAATAISGQDGCAELPTAATQAETSSRTTAGLLTVQRSGFASAHVALPRPGERADVILVASTVQQTVTVHADRGLFGVTDQATSVAVLSQAQMRAEPGLSLDDRLHQAAGFQLFRRTSSWTANPTTEGVSLRGLGSTAASRTLVVSDEVPLNDPFGGWIHWNELPLLAVADVALIRGGSADLYGSSAIGGVIELQPVRALESGPSVRVLADALGATEDSAQADLLVTVAGRKGSLLLAGSGVTTGGYIATAPAVRGPIDTQSNVSQQSGRVELGRSLWGAPGSDTSPGTAAQSRTTNHGSAFLWGNVLNEARGNGTPLQTNGTRLWRLAGGGDADSALGHASLRVFGDREAYRQSFSSLAVNRATEALTRLQRVPTDEFGFALSASHPFGSTLTGAVGLDLRDIRATDAEAPVSRGVLGAEVAISARQRDLGGYGEAFWERGGWSVAGSVRVDTFRTFDGRQITAGSPAVTALQQVQELVASPHIGLVRRLPWGLALTGNAFRAFRGPTLNELYRTGQVGQQTTLANPLLLAERATGFELGGEAAEIRAHGHTLGHLRASYFWTEVNRPVSTVLLAQTSTAQTLQRQNLGQIRSRGLSLDAASASWRGVDAILGYQFADATVTAFNTQSALQANLLGKWIPQVPRQLVTATVNLQRARVVNVHLIASYTGQAFDDSANQFLLHPYARFDLAADRDLAHGLSLYAGAQNLLNRSIDAGRTPLLTLASPRLVQGGLRWSFGR